MSPAPYPRSFGSRGRPTRRARKRDAQPELDQRCVACKAGSHRNCRSADCTCNHREARDA